MSFLQFFFNRIVWLLLRCFAAVLIPWIVTCSFPNKYPPPLAVVVPPDQPAADALLVLYSPSRAAFRCIPECLWAAEITQAWYLKGKLPPTSSPSTNGTLPKPSRFGLVCMEGQPSFQSRCRSALHIL